MATPSEADAQEKNDHRKDVTKASDKTNSVQHSEQSSADPNPQPGTPPHDKRKRPTPDEQTHTTSSDRKTDKKAPGARKVSDDNEKSRKKDRRAKDKHQKGHCENGVGTESNLRREDRERKEDRSRREDRERKEDGVEDSARKENCVRKENRTRREDRARNKVDRSRREEDRLRREEEDRVGREEDCVEDKKSGEGEGGGGRRRKEGDGESDPLGVDLYERLCEEKSDAVPPGGGLQWEGCRVGRGLMTLAACKRMPYLERYFHALLMSIFMAVTFAMVFGLCVLQAQMSMHTKELLAKVQGPKRPMPEGMYSLYYDYLDSGVLPENVDMRANTTIFVH